MRSLNSTVGSKKYNVDIELLSRVNQWKLTPGINGSSSYIYIYIGRDQSNKKKVYFRTYIYSFLHLQTKNLHFGNSGKWHILSGQVL
jgi:hypothetical protein